MSAVSLPSSDFSFVSPRCSSAWQLLFQFCPFHVKIQFLHVHSSFKPLLLGPPLPWYSSVFHTGECRYLWSPRFGLAYDYKHLLQSIPLISSVVVTPMVPFECPQSFLDILIMTKADSAAADRGDCRSPLHLAFHGFPSVRPLTPYTVLRTLEFDLRAQFGISISVGDLCRHLVPSLSHLRNVEHFALRGPFMAPHTGYRSHSPSNFGNGPEVPHVHCLLRALGKWAQKLRSLRLSHLDVSWEIPPQEGKSGFYLGNNIDNHDVDDLSLTLSPSLELLELASLSQHLTTYTSVASFVIYAASQRCPRLRTLLITNARLINDDLTMLAGALGRLPSLHTLHISLANVSSPRSEALGNAIYALRGSNLDTLVLRGLGLDTELSISGFPHKLRRLELGKLSFDVPSTPLDRLLSSVTTSSLSSLYFFHVRLYFHQLRSLVSCLPHIPIVGFLDVTLMGSAPGLTHTGCEAVSVDVRPLAPALAHLTALRSLFLRTKEPFAWTSPPDGALCPSFSEELQSALLKLASLEEIGVAEAFDPLRHIQQPPLPASVKIWRLGNYLKSAD